MHKVGGIILAGGKSSRMGTDKAYVKVDGIEMMTYVVKTLKEVCAEVCICTNHISHNSFQQQLIFDKYQGKGPIAGILSGLEYSSYELNFVLSCDTPFISVQILEKLLLSAENSSSEATIAYCNGQLYPLCGVYSRNSRALIESLLKKDVKKLRTVLSHLNVTIESFPDTYEKYFLNINTPDDVPEKIRGYEY